MKTAHKSGEKIKNIKKYLDFTYVPV